MNRKETTKFLSNLLINTRLTGLGKHYASEVTLDYGSSSPKRVNFMLFEPENTLSISGIERGMFTCFEIKSCKEDVYSGNGLNFEGDKNYMVTTMQCWKDLGEDYRSGKLDNHIKSCNDGTLPRYGIMVAIPEHSQYELSKFAGEEYENPTPLSEDIRWQLYIVKPCSRDNYRKRSITELLFCMLRSGT